MFFYGTLVLYFGDGEWNRPRTLLGCLNVPDRLKPYVSDYEMNLFEICKLTDKHISGFRSDFKIIVDYLAKRRKVPGYRGTKDTIRHVDEFFKLMKVLTNDNKFATVYNENISIEEGGVSMCDFLDTVEAKGEIKGKAVVIQELLKTGKMNIEQIADMLKLSIEKVTELAEMNLVPVV